MSVVVMVIGFYFGTQHEAKNAANGAVSGNATPGAITPPPSEKGANADNELKGLIENGQIYIKE
jgi:hypothetical protein